MVEKLKMKMKGFHVKDREIHFTQKKSSSIMWSFNWSSLWAKKIVESNVDLEEEAMINIDDVRKRPWMCEKCRKTYLKESHLDQHQASKGHFGKVDTLKVLLQIGTMICNYGEGPKSYLKESHPVQFKASKDKGHFGNVNTTKLSLEIGFITHRMNDILVWDGTNQNGVISRQFHRLVQLQAIKKLKSAETFWRLECCVNQKIHCHLGHMVAKLISTFLTRSDIKFIKRL